MLNSVGTSTPAHPPRRYDALTLVTSHHSLSTRARGRTLCGSQLQQGAPDGLASYYHTPSEKSDGPIRCDVSIPVSWQHPSIPSSSYSISSRPTTERHGSNILPGLCTARTSLLSLCLQLTRLKRSISELSGGVRVEHSMQQHNILVIHCLRESSHAIFPRT